MPGDSPYFTGAAPNFGPPSGLAGLLQQNREGAVDFKGAQMFADVVDKFKSEQDMGKAADYFVKANPDAMAAMGVHPEQWKTLGSREKTAAVTGFMKGQASQELMQQLADLGRKRKAEQEFGDVMRDASVGTAEVPGRLSFQPPLRIQVPQAPTMDSFARAAAGRPNAWTARGAAPFVEAAAAGGSADLKKFNAETERLRAEAYRKQVDSTGKPLPAPTKAPTIFDVGGGRRGYWEDGNTFKTFTDDEHLPAAVQSQLATYYSQLGSTLAALGDPKLGAKARAALEKDRDRYLQQIEQVRKGFAPAASPAPAGGSRYTWQGGKLVPAQ